MDKAIQTEKALSDVMTEKPIDVEIGGTHYKIAPPTLGKMQILSKYYLDLEINEDELSKSPIKEAMRICQDKADEVCALMAVAVSNSKQELLDDERIKALALKFKWSSSPEDFSALLISLLLQTNYENFMSSIRLTGRLRQNKPIESAREARVEQ